MFKYVQVRGGIVASVQTSTSEINHPDLISFDGELPEIGSTYDGGVFTAPAVVVEAIRKISKGAFRRRLTLAEKVAILESADSTVKVLNEDLNASSFIDLDFQPFIDGLAYLVVVGILTDARKAELLADGTPDEAF